MSLVVPDTAEVRILQSFLTLPLTLRLYSNNYTPIATSLAASFTEVAGGGYVSKALTFANWTITANAPSLAVYPLLSWVFTGVTNAPAVVYGYFVTRDSDGLLMYAERFAPAIVPITPVGNTIIQLIPQFSAGSLF